MNIAKVSERLMVLTGADSEEIARMRPLVEDACDYVQRRCKIAAPNSAQQRRLEALSAAYAWKLYSLSGDSLSQFIAGDVHLTSSADGGGNAERYWRELLRHSGDLIDDDRFLFGRVMT